MRHRQITAPILLADVYTFRLLSAYDHPRNLYAHPFTIFAFALFVGTS